MATAPQLVSVEEYLHTTYRPDCDYIDGVVVERNLGTFDHASLQGLLVGLFFVHRKEWNVLGLPELRLKVRERKYRIPDVMVLPLGKHPPVIEQAPLLCIEVVSPDDRVKDLTERAKDYLALGVPETWIFDPETREAFVYSAAGLHSAPPVLQCGAITLSLAELWATD
jgi:Uma2 family endonuclease